MSGQSEVQTGSRKVRATHVAPQAGQADRVAVLVGQREGGAGRFRALGVPSSASVRIGSAFWLTAAIAIGAVPMSDDGQGSEGGEGAGDVRRRGAVPPAGRRPAVPAVAGHRHLGRDRAPGSWPTYARDEQEGHRQHGVGVGARAAEEAQVLDEHPVGQAEHDQGDRPTRTKRRRPLKSRSADGDEGDDDEQVHRPAVRGVERAERGEPRREDMGLGGLRHGRTIAESGAAPPLPEPPTRPGLEDGHADEEHATQGEHDTAETG